MASSYFDWRDHNDILAASSSFEAYKGDLVAEFQRAYGWEEKEVRLYYVVRVGAARDGQEGSYCGVLCDHH
jgi:hypothetical protein